MTSTTAAQAFADAASRMVSRGDPAGDLVLLLIDCADLLSAEAVGLLVAIPDNGLELLAPPPTGPGNSNLRTPKRIWPVHRRNPPRRTGDRDQPGAGHCLGPSWSTDRRPRLPLGTRVPADLARHRDRGSERIPRRPRGPGRRGSALGRYVRQSRHCRPCTPAGHRRHRAASADHGGSPGTNVIEQADRVIAFRENLEMSDAFSRLLQLAASSGRLLSQVAGDILTSVSPLS